MPKAVRLCTISAILLLPLFFFFGCSGGDKAAPAGANVNVRISDPATCSGPAGAFSHIYVTITDVRISASNGDSGWIDLTPSLAQNPQQIDLLGQANNQCFLATLGATTALQPGSYQQIRIMLADNSTAVANNVCGATANCVMISSSPNTALPLLLSSEAHTGIKIPSGQIAGGQFSIAAGETKDLDIDFNACESIVAQGNGQFRLKPVLHAGEVSLTSTSINGTAVDSVTNQPITGGNTVVALEQKDGSGVDRVVMQAVTDNSGAFSFCPVAAGTYDVVIGAVSGTQVAYAVTVITGVQPGNTLGFVPVVAQTGMNTSPASITGQVTTSTGSAATTADISITALQPITSLVMVTVPLAGQSATSAHLTTAPNASCPTNTDCATYTMMVPAMNPSVGAFAAAASQTPAPPLAGPVSYTIDAFAFMTDGSSTPDCSPSEVKTSSTSSNVPLTVTSGQSSTAATLTFSGCQ